MEKPLYLARRLNFVRVTKRRIFSDPASPCRSRARRPARAPQPRPTSGRRSHTSSSPFACCTRASCTSATTRTTTMPTMCVHRQTWPPHRPPTPARGKSLPRPPCRPAHRLLWPQPPFGGRHIPSARAVSARAPGRAAGAESAPRPIPHSAGRATVPVDEEARQGDALDGRGWLQVRPLRLRLLCQGEGGQGGGGRGRVGAPERRVYTCGVCVCVSIWRPHGRRCIGCAKGAPGEAVTNRGAGREASGETPRRIVPGRVICGAGQSGAAPRTRADAAFAVSAGIRVAQLGARVFRGIEVRRATFFP